MSADDARARFAAATQTHLTLPLGDGVTIRHVTLAEVMEVGDRLWAGDPRPHGRVDVFWSDEHKARAADLAAVMGEPMQHRLVFEHRGEAVGSYWGSQETIGRYYMVNTVFAPAFQGRGLYRALLPRVVAAVADAGFAELYSRHRADNNAILVPKLKAGFVIAAFEITPKFGLLVHLRRYLVDGVDRLHGHRVDGAFGVELRARGALPGV